MRYVYSARCTWNETIDKVGHTPDKGDGITIPCCPHCGSVLSQKEDEQLWWRDVDAFEQRGNPGYRKFAEWLRGKCFPNYTIAKAKYDEEMKVMITAKAFPRMVGTPGIELALRGHIELLEQGMASQAINISNKTLCILGYVKEVPVGVMAWQDWEDQDSVFIQHSYVLPVFREQGVMSAMFAVLIEETKKLKRKHIHSSTHVANKKMQEVARRQGRVEESIGYRYDIGEKL